jgi:uncharacterized membrane protein YbhN (UPF0104 family)
VLLVGAAVALLLTASVGIAHRDAWLAALRSHRRLAGRMVAGVVVVIAGTLLVAHRDALASLLRRIEGGDPWWLGIAVGAEAISFSGYVALTRIVHSPVAPRLNRAVSVELTLAGVVATRLLSAGGAGGIAFTAWVLRRAGMAPGTAGRRLAAFLSLLYASYIGALLIGGLLVTAGAVEDVPHALGITALAVGGTVTAAALLTLRFAPGIARRAAAMEGRRGRLGRIAGRVSAVPREAGAVARLAIVIARGRPGALLWPLVWWAGDVATLWAAFHAFGQAPATGTIVLCYFLGQLGNLLPLPGGVGGTEGGMVGAFIACDVDAGLAVVAVVAYQAISTYLPAVPGLPAYAILRRQMRGWEGEPEPATS